MRPGARGQNFPWGAALVEASVLSIGLGVVAGLLERAYFLWADVRQYPTYPHNRVVHFFLGFVAAMLGALAVPAVVTHNFIAGVFLAAGAQQFHAVRAVERQMLDSLDRVEAVPRGPAYIEAIAMGFEARNYLVVLTALVTTFTAFVSNWVIGLTVGLASIVLTQHILRFPTMERVADVDRIQPEVSGNTARAGPFAVEVPAESGFSPRQVRALRLRPKRTRDRLALSAQGQIQALLYEVASAAGVLRPDLDAMLPHAHFDAGSGSLIVTYIPAHPDLDRAEDAVRHAPLLETAAQSIRMSAWRGRV